MGSVAHENSRELSTVESSSPLSCSFNLQGRDIIYRCFALNGLADETTEAQGLEILAQVSHVQTFKPGKPVVEQGTSPDFVYFILDGSVEIARELRNGAWTVVDQLHEGEMFGEIAVLRNSLRTCRVNPCRETTCLLVPQGPFRAFVESNPAADMILKGLIDERLHEMYAYEPAPPVNGVPCLSSLRLLLVNEARRHGETLGSYLETHIKDSSIVELFSGPDAPVAQWFSSLGCSSVQAIDIQAPRYHQFPGYMQASAEDLSFIPDNSVDLFVVINYLQDGHNELRNGEYYEFSPEFFSAVSRQIERKLKLGGALLLVTGDTAQEITPHLEAVNLRHFPLVRGFHEYRKE